MHQFNENMDSAAGQLSRVNNTANKNSATQATPRAPSNKKMSMRRKDVMENFRMRMLRNLDLAIEIVLDQGVVILKKYDDLDFYIDQIADGKIFELKAKEMLRKNKKTKQKLNQSVSVIHKKRPNDDDSFVGDSDEGDEDNLTVMATKEVEEKMKTPQGDGRMFMQGNQRDRAGNDVLNVKDMFSKVPQKAKVEN